MREINNYKKKSVLWAAAGCAVRVPLAILMIYIPKVVLDSLEQNATMKALFSRIVLFGIATAVVQVLNLVVHNTMESCSKRYLYKKLIRAWEQKVMELDYEILTSVEGKSLAEQARNVVSSPNWGVVMYLPGLTNLLENLTGLLTYGVIIGDLQPILLVLLVVIFAIELCFTFIIEKKKHTLQVERAVWTRKINYLAYETRGLQEGKDIRVYAMEPWLREITKQVIVGKDRVEQRGANCQFRRNIVTGLLILIRDGIAYGYLVYSFLQQQVSIGDFLFYFGAITGLGNWLTDLVDSIGQFVEARNYMADYEAFMKLGGEQPGESMNIPKEEKLSFTFENVFFFYGAAEEEETEYVIKNLNLTISAGERLAIVGINGAGKTTLVKLLSGMLEPKTGRVLVNGEDNRGFSKEAYYSLFSAVFQSSGVLPISIAENVMLNVRPEANRELMWECLEKSGLKEKVEGLPQGDMTTLVKGVAEQGTAFSGGEMQRLLLARALYKDAPVLILDEPTAALDPLAEREIYERYHELTKGKTAIFISHRLASTRFCDRIVLLEQGKIAEQGSHEELMQLGGKYAEMFRVQSYYYKEEVACS